MTLPAAAQTPPAAAEGPDAVQLTQAQPDAPRPGMGERRQGPMHGHGGWHRHKMHRFSLAGLALRHRQELALTPAQVDSLRKLGTDAQRDAIKRQADRRLAELDLRTMMMPDPADANKPRDLVQDRDQGARDREAARGWARGADPHHGAEPPGADAGAA